jgi:CheY-like chemotaxis protein/nitrogen-specific signal transduction histidine kinase
MEREEAYQQHVREARTSARNDFLANMSHDIRTPMNAIVGYTNIAKTHQDKPGTVADALDKIGSSSHYLLSLINDILDISKIESGKMQISSAPCDLAALFRRIEDITALQAQNKALNITYCHDSIRHYKVNADELRLEQILINIISNAIKYTPSGKSVELISEEIPLSDGKNTYRFIVRDTGIGISEEYLPHIFESFTREERTTINRIQGTGLGLAITAKIVEMMGGTISVKSKLGEGSEFTVEIALESVETEEPASAENHERLDLAGRKILLVEDNDINAEIARMVLEQFGAEVQRAENGKTGVDALQEKEPDFYDVVLMDIQMPVMNGYEAAKAIRSLGGPYSSLPIIAMSANAYEEDVRDCLAAGMDGHIAKPFDPAELLRVLHKYIKD